mgnify:CR=1 FL=1
MSTRTGISPNMEKAPPCGWGAFSTPGKMVVHATLTRYRGLKKAAQPACPEGQKAGGRHIDETTAFAPSPMSTRSN